MVQVIIPCLHAWHYKASCQHCDSETGAKTEWLKFVMVVLQCMLFSRKETVRAADPKWQKRGERYHWSGGKNIGHWQEVILPLGKEDGRLDFDPWSASHMHARSKNITPTQCDTLLGAAARKACILRNCRNKRHIQQHCEGSTDVLLVVVWGS